MIRFLRQGCLTRAFARERFSRQEGRC
jgi:hypothetical protein